MKLNFHKLNTNVCYCSRKQKTLHFEAQAGYCSCNYIYFPVAFLAIV